MAKKICCPRFTCGSSNVIPIDTKKKFSLGKALVGNAIGGFFGPAGAIVGTAAGINGKNGKTKFICQDCGHVFEKKI